MLFLKFTTNANELIVNGATFNIKEMLKLHGARWNPAANAWTLSISVDSPALRAELEAATTSRVAAEKVERAAARAYAKSPAGIAATVAADYRYAKARGWTCCEKARVVDLQRGHCSCLTHGLHVRGRLYTGD